MVRAKKDNSENPLHICGIACIAPEVSFSGYSGTIHYYVDGRKLLERVHDFFPNGHIANHRDEVLPQIGLYDSQRSLIDIDAPDGCTQSRETRADRLA